MSVLIFLITPLLITQVQANKNSDVNSPDEAFKYWQFSSKKPLFDYIIPGNKVIANEANVNCLKKIHTTRH
jgi:hypothetical protein